MKIIAADSGKENEHDKIEINSFANNKWVWLVYHYNRTAWNKQAGK